MANFTQVGVEAVVKNFNKFNKDLNSMNKAIAQSGKSSEQAAKATNKYNATLQSFAAGGLDRVIGALVAFGKASIEEGMAFQKVMSNVAAVSGAVGKDFEALEKQAKALGSTTKFTATEAAEGMSFLAMAGFETNEIIAAMPGTLNLAAAANMDLADSADIVSNIIQGFGADAQNTGQFVDVLTKTFTTSNTSLQQLGAAMKFAAPVAKSLGMTVEDTAASIGVLGNAGIQGSLAGTTLRGVLLSLASPTKAAQAIMDELGIAVFDAQGNMLPMPQIIGNINRATAGMTQEQRNATLQTLVGARRLAGFNVLLAEGETSLQAYGNELRDSVGTAAEVADKQLDNLAGDFTLFQSALSGFKIGTFELLEPALRETAQAATWLATKLGEGAQAWSYVVNEAVPAIQAHNVATSDLIGQNLAMAKSQEEFAHILHASSIDSQESLDAFRQSFVSNTASFEDFQTQLGKLSQSTTIYGDELVLVTDLLEMNEAEYQALSQSVTDLDRTRQTESERLSGLATMYQKQLEATTGNIKATDQDTAAIISNIDSRETQRQIADAYVGSLIKEAENTKELIKAKEEEQAIRQSLILSAGEYFGSYRELQEEQLQSEQEYNASIAAIRSGAAEEQKSQQTELSEELTALEQERQEKIQWVLSGAHSRTQAENDAALAHWNQHYDQLVTDTTTKYGEQTAAIEAERAKQEASARAAREKEVAEQQAHLDKLKLNAALATLETTGQLTQFTGGLAVSAQEAADLIEAGILPVTDELAMAIQSTLGQLQAQEAATATQAQSNQAVLQDALAGTLEPLDQQAIAMGTTIPASAQATQNAMLAMNTDAQLGLQNTQLETQNEDLALQNVSNVTLPMLDQSMMTMNQNAQSGLIVTQSETQTLDDMLSNMGNVTLPAVTESFNSATEAGKTMADEVGSAMDKLNDNLDDFEKIIKNITSELEKLAAAAESAFRSAAGATDQVAAAAGIGYEKGIGFGKGLGFQQGTLGLGATVPPGYPNDTFGPIFLTSREQFMVTPPGMTIDEAVMDRLVADGPVAMMTVNHFNLNVSTVASAPAVIQQYEIARAMIQ